MDQHLPLREVASKLACSEATVRRMIRNGSLPALRLGQRGTFRVSERDVLSLSSGSSVNKKRQLSREEK